MLNKNREYHAYEVGQIVYMYQAKGSIVQTGSRKIACYFVGPLVIYKAIGPNQFYCVTDRTDISTSNRRNKVETRVNLDK